MKRFILTIIALVSINTQAMAEESFEDISRMIAEKAKIDVNIVKDNIKSGLWNNEKTAFALSINKPGGSLCFVLIKQTNNSFLAVDVSNVEYGNFGKFGYPRSFYDRYETIPIEWLKRDDSHFQVVFRTRAWKNGQRYTVTEPLILKHNGEPIWR